jgi:uncharacterized protein (TIGR02266 family)
MSDDDSAEDRDRRVHPRADMVLKVEYPSIEGFLQDYTVNLSRGGTMIRIGRELAVGDYVELNLTFPGLLAPIHRKGVVRWVQQEAPEDLTAGVEFDERKSDEATELEELVERIRAGDRAVVAPLVRILVVEDNPHVAKLIADGLSTYRRRSNEPLAFTTRYATNGREALAQVAEEPCDVMLVDMYLPVMDGEALIRRLRSDERYRRLPVIALSAGGQDARDRALAAGADFFLDKPVRLAEVLGTMRLLMATILKDEA